jgi:phospholipid/cholesterol/gamma-HCH transport system substrate-binding protein
MRTKAGYFKIGLFVLALTGVLIAGVLWLGANTLFRESVLLETYMDESVQGLAVGSPVMQRGVQIGTVKEITFVPREYPMPTDPDEAAPYRKLVMVVMSIDKAHFTGAVSDHDVRDILQQWVDNGLRLKLSPQGITGIYYMEADFVDPKRYPAPVPGPWTRKYHYVPSTTSLFRSFSQSADSLFQSLSKVDFEKLAGSLQQSFDSITVGVQDAQLGRVREELIRLITQLQQASSHATNLLDPNAPDTGSANLPQFVNQLNVTLKRIDQFVSTQQPELERIVANLNQASANLRELTENAKKDPAQLFFSVPPKPTEVAP